MSTELNNEKTTIGCFKNTSDSFNEIKDLIAEEIRPFHSPRIHKQDLTLQCFIRCWTKSSQEVKDSIIHNIIKELKVNE